jgi:hypothetical protein
MNPTSELPADVLEFIENRIDSVPHIEALLLLWESAPDRWEVEQIAARIYVATPSAAQILRDLVRRRLVRAAGEEPAGFAYDSEWDPDGTLMAKVAATYRQNLVLVAQKIHSKAASASVREFARAFEIKKDG